MTAFPPALFVQFSSQLEATDNMAIGGLTWITLPPTSFSLYSAATDCFLVAMNWNVAQVMAPMRSLFYLSVLIRLQSITSSHKTASASTLNRFVTLSLQHTDLSEIWCKSVEVCTWEWEDLRVKKQQLVDAAILIYRATVTPQQCSS